ncbi:MAG TPA: YhgE/Pip family protein, partial [Candidatus Limnocylindrales bacterium]|nr:YhgE/Pip family protein [Candidatus Limnocylindrales bacterium]
FLAAAGWDVSSLLDTFLVVLVFGVGTDYAIFLISRYREEVSHDGDWHDAARITVRRIGAVITASAGTVIVGMLAMGVGDFRMVATMGPGIAIAVAVTLAANLTLTPALLSIFGHYLFWPLHTRAKPEGEPRGFFASLAAAVSRRPGLVTVMLLVALIVPSLYVPQVRSNFDVLADLPADADSRIGYEQIAAHLGDDKLVQSTGLIDAGGGADMLAPAQLAKLHQLMAQLQATGGMATTTSIVTPDGDTTVPDGFRPSKNLATIADGFAGDGNTSGDSGSLLDPEVKDGLNQALDYVNGLGVAFPDIAAGTQMRETKAGLEHALDIVDRVQRQSVLSTQLRTLSSSITSPANAAGGGDSSSTLMSDYLAELATAYPEVKGLHAYKDAVRAARALERDASVGAALDLADAFDRLADHFDSRPDATLSPKSLAGTASAKELKREAEDTFNALPDQLTALAAVFAPRPDDIWIPTTLTGDDGAKVQDAIDAFISKDHSATRFYVTSASDPYTGDAFATIKEARVVLDDAAPAFGPAASGHIGGPTAQFTDVQDTLARDFQKVGAITVIGILLVLIVLLRAIVAPLYLVATVLVSYASTIGLSGFLFQEILGQPGISPYLPLMVFVLLVALGSDYNIFLMHRVREEAETRPMRDAVRIASGHTGAVITSAGLILAGTFGSMATAPLTILFQVGIAVAIGVLIDTFLVRSILVPAITTLVGDRAWWPSGAVLAGALGRAPGTPVPAGAGVALPASSLATGPADAVVAPTPAPMASPAPPSGRSRRRFAVAIALVVLIPVTVAGILTWSFGSASGNIGAVRAAVVNLDDGGTVPSLDGTPQLLSLGSDLVTALTSGGGGFTWVATDAAAAETGLANGDYAAVLTVPADFSRSVAAIRTDTTGTAPKATLHVSTDDSSGYTLGTVARAVTSAIGTATAQDITASYVDDVLVQVTTARDALTSGATDAGAIADDGASLADDAKGTGAIAGTVSSGLRQLADGATSAADGTTQLVGGMNQLAAGTTKLAGGASKLAGGTKTASDGAAKLSAGAADLAHGLSRLDTETKALPAQTAQLADGASGVAAGASGLADGLDSLATNTDGMGAMATGLDQLVDGIRSTAGTADTKAGATASDAAALATAAGALATDAGSLAGTLGTLSTDCAASGAAQAFCDQLATAASDAAGVGSEAGGVASDAGSVATGAGTVAGYTAAIVDLADQAHQVAHGLAQLLPPVEDGIAGSATGATKLAGGATQLSDGVGQLADGMPALASGISKLADGATALADGLDTYAAGMVKLSNATTALASGAQQTASGANRLADGAASAAGGIDQLTGAMAAAADGAALVETQVKNLADDGTALADKADTLHGGLTDAASGLGSYDATTRTRVGGLAADPVTVDAERVNAIAGAQSGFAPYFMALAAWLGALGAFLVLPAVSRRDDRRWWLAVLWSLAVAGGVAVLGSLLMVVVLDVVLGVSVAQPLVLASFAVLAAISFTAVVQALVALFGTRGWFAGLLLLVLGIAASGLGVEAAAVPGPLALIRPLLPLTYAIDAFRAAIAGAGGSLAVDAVALLAFLVAGVLVTLASVAGAERDAAEDPEPAAA